VRVNTALKVALTRVGSVCSERMIYALNATLNYLEVGWWVRANNFIPRARVPTRERVFDVIADEIGEQPVLYMEFGVGKGSTLRYWSALLRHPDSLLHGFDSFEGLPTRWTYGKEAGLFSTGGEGPATDDPRVRFFKGLFQQTLPTYESPDHEVLIANIDADLYSSATAALEHVKDHLGVGSYLYFDEFNYRADELRAFDEFLRANTMQFELVAATRDLTSVAFRRTS
jgi:O-methyltransferase